jgi:hypothetical protein
MKKFLITLVITVLLVFISSFQCKKNAETNNNQTTAVENTDNKDKIDIEEMKKTIADSTEMNTQVFVAIAVYHKYYTNQFGDTTKNMTDEEKSKFFEDKKNEFFKSLKYSEKEYNDYMQKNNNDINDYIINHPEITAYLTSIN